MVLITAPEMRLLSSISLAVAQAPHTHIGMPVDTMAIIISLSGVKFTPIT
jgi:hypothetical protein